MINFIKKGGVDTSDATATASDIIAPKTAYVNGTKLAGLMVATEKTLSVQEYKRYSVLPTAPAKIYNDSIAISGYIIDVTQDNTNLYIDVIQNNTLLKHEEFSLSSIGFFTDARNIAVSYDKITSEGIDIVVGIVKEYKNASQNGIINFNFKKFLFNPTANTIVENSTLLNANWTVWLGDKNVQVPNMVADREDKNLFHVIAIKEDYGQRTCFRNFKVTWDDQNVGSLTGNMNEISRLYTNWQNNKLRYTGDGTYLTYCRGLIQFTNVSKSALTTKDIGNPIYLSHSKKYMLIGTTVYKVTPNSNLDTMYNSRVSIGTVDSNTDGFFSLDDNYLIITTSNAFKIYTLSENSISLSQTFSRAGIYTVPWDSNYMFSNQNDDTGIFFYNCTGETVIKQLERDNRVYHYAESDEVPLPAEVLTSKKYIGLNGLLQTGSMSNNGQLSYTPSTSQQTIPAGYTSGGTIAAVTSAIDSDIQAGNIRSGVNILGVTGSSSVVNTSDANAIASDIIDGKTAYVNGIKITGTGSGGSINIVNGIVEQYKASTTTINANTFVEFVNDTLISSDLYSYQGVKAVWIDDNKVFVTHRGDMDNTEKLCGVVCEISGTTITFGTAVAIAGRNTYFNVDVTMIDTDKVFVSHKKSSSLYGVVCEISGTTITPGTDTLISNTANTYEESKVASIDTDKVFIIHRGANDILSGIVCEISGTTITVGADTEISNQTSEYSTGSYLFSDIISVDTDKVFIIHQYHNANMGGYTLWGTLCTVSGTTITAEPEIEIDQDTSGRGFGYQYSSITLLDTDKIFITYYHYSDSSLRGVVCEISGTTVTFGTAVSLDTIDASGMDYMNTRSNNIVTVSPDIEKVFTIYDVGLNTRNLKGIVCTINGTTITPGNSIYLDDIYYSEEGLSAVVTDTDEVFVTHQGSKDSRLDLYGIHYSLMNNNIKAVSTIKESETRVDGITKTQCTTSVEGDIYVLDTANS